MHNLNQRQQAAVMAYIETGVQLTAYERAGYSQRGKPESIKQRCSTFFAQEKIKAAIAELQAEHRERHKVTVDRIVDEMAIIAFARFDQFHDFDERGHPHINLNKVAETNPELFAAVASSKIKTKVESLGDGEFEEVREIEVKFNDKRAALVDLGKHLGMFKETVVHEGELAITNAANEFDEQFDSFAEDANKAAASVLH